MRKTLKTSTVELVKVSRHGQITIPRDLRKKFKIAEGDYVELNKKNNQIILRPIKVINPEQEYFYTKEWQKEELEADKDLASGKISGPYKSASVLFKELDK